MALKVTQVEVWAGSIEDRPGELARVLEALAEAGANLECVIARREPAQPGKGQVFVCPLRGKRAQEAAKSVGMSPATDMGTLRVEGPDKPGLGGRLARAIADAGINLRGVSAAVIGGRFVAYFGFDSSEDAKRAASALKAVDAARRRPAARAKRPARA